MAADRKAELLKKAQRCRAVSHAITHLSGMKRRKTAPSDVEWEHSNRLYPADAVFDFGNEILGWAESLERQAEKAA